MTPTRSILSLVMLAAVFVMDDPPGIRFAASLPAWPAVVPGDRVSLGGDLEPAAIGRFVHVYVDATTRRPVAVPQSIRAALIELGATA